MFDITARRRHEIAQIALRRHHGLPDALERAVYLETVAHHLDPPDGDLAFALDTFARRCGWRLAPTEIERIAAKAKASPRRRLKADTVARMLGLSYEERTRYGVTTIGAVDADKAERTRRRKQRDRERKAARRRAKGAKARSQYLAQSKARTQPWTAEGISRRTWYRRRGTGPSAPNYPLAVDGLVPPALSRAARQQGVVRKKHSRLRRDLSPQAMTVM